MGASVGGGGAGGTRRRRRRSAPIVEMNMTPFIDVMLVLLIIFMVAAPMLTVGVPIELPRSAARPIQDETQPVTISVKTNGDVFIQETQTTLEELVPKLQAIARNGVEERIFIRGDRNANYGTMMQVMGRVNAAGFKRIGLVTEVDPAQNAATPSATPAQAPARPGATAPATPAGAPRQAQR